MSSMIEGSITTGICEKTSHLIFLPLTMGGQKIDLTLGHRYTKIRDIQVVGSYGLITFRNFQSAQSSTVALTWSQSCIKVM